MNIHKNSAVLLPLKSQISNRELVRVNKHLGNRFLIARKAISNPCLRCFSVFLWQIDLELQIRKLVARKSLMLLKFENPHNQSYSKS